MSYQPYPKWVRCADGADRIVQDHVQHSALTGVEHGPDGKPVIQFPKPPTLEEVIAAGYGQEAAEAIVERETAKAAAGIEPYGPNPVPTPDVPAPEQPDPAAAQDAVRKLDALVNPLADPFGMFSSKE